MTLIINSNLRQWRLLTNIFVNTAVLLLVGILTWSFCLDSFSFNYFLEWFRRTPLLVSIFSRLLTFILFETIYFNGFQIVISRFLYNFWLIYTIITQLRFSLIFFAWRNAFELSLLYFIFGPSVIYWGRTLLHLSIFTFRSLLKQLPRNLNLIIAPHLLHLC